MRITNKMMNGAVLTNINTNLQRLNKSQTQLSSGQRINRPSDDPAATAQLLAAKSALQSQEQYRNNMEDAMGWLDANDRALVSANDVLQRTRELAVYGSNGTLPVQSMTALADEVDNLIGEMIQIGNTNYAGRFIFGGAKTTQPPFTVAATVNSRVTSVQFIETSFDTTLLAETYKLELEIEAGVKLDIASGLKTFHTDSNGNSDLNAVFEKMIELRQNLDAGNQAAVNSLIDDFDKMIDNVLSERAIVGTKSKRMEVAQERSSAYELNLNDLVGKLEDIDYAKTSIDFYAQKTVYEAALATGAQIIRPSLIDFLK